MNIQTSESCYTYPGQFVPAGDEKEIIRHLKNSYRKLMHPFISIKESTDLYEVQVSAPDLEREEFIVYGDNSFLLVDASATTGINQNKKNLHSNISMPTNADTELTVA